MKWALFAIPACVAAGAFLCGSAQALPQPPSQGLIAALPSSSLLAVRYHRHYRHYRSRRSGGEPTEANADASAGAGTIKPGEWQFSAQLQTQAAALPPARPQSTAEPMPTGALKSTYRSCIAADKAVPAAFGPGCTLDGVQRDGARLTWSMTCTNRQSAVRSDGTAQYRGDTMEGTMVSHLPVSPAAAGGKAKATDLTQHISGRYLGPCPRLAQSPQTPILPPRATLALGAGSGSSAQWVEPPAQSAGAASAVGATAPTGAGSAGATAAARSTAGQTAAEPAAPPTPEPAAATAAHSIEAPSAIPSAPSGTATQATTGTSETAAAAAPRAQQYRRYAAPRRYYRRHYYRSYAAGPPNILALPFTAIHGLFGQ